jgi:hypothetical protein
MLLPLFVAGVGVLALIAGHDSSSDRFGADDAFVPSLPTPIGHEDVLGRITAKLRRLRDVSSDPALDALGKVDSEVEKNVRTIVRDSPAFVVDTIKGVVQRAAESSGDDFPVRMDVENLDDAVDALDAIKKALDRSPAIRRLTSKALEVLDDEDLIGEGPLSTALSILLASAAGTLQAARFSRGGEVTIVTPSFRITVDKLGNYAAKLKVRNPMWAKSAVEVALSGSTSSPVSAATVRAPVQVSRRVTVSPYASASEKERRAGVDARISFGGLGGEWA